jgi:hypothetical protein
MTMITLLDKGPTDTAAPDYEAWHKEHDAPVEVRMHSIDAQHALAADPERYEEVRRDAVIRKSGSTEDRLTAIEERLDELEDEDDGDGDEVKE